VRALNGENRNASGKPARNDQEGGTVGVRKSARRTRPPVLEGPCRSRESGESHKAQKGCDRARRSQRQAGISPVRVLPGPSASAAKRMNVAAMPGTGAYVSPPPR
jgi:hypothetical protein